MASRRFILGLLALVASVAGTACTDQSSATNLYLDGPPKIAQVRIKERYTDAGGTVQTRTVFGFGTHPQIPAGVDDAHAVTNALATDNKLRVIIDHLLVGNTLEEIQCRGIVDSDAFSRVPLGDTPDDIARCAVASDALIQTCPGSDPRSVCICQNDGGCNGVNKGDPVGVLDVNQDGAADNTSFIQGAVGIKCGAIDVPIDLDASYWNPSGNQQVPAVTGGIEAGFDELGPAIVLIPKQVGGVSVMPTNITCGLSFDPSVVDKRNVQVCAPANGDYTQACTPGDVSLVTFKTEALVVSPQSPPMDNSVGVLRTDDMIMTTNAPFDPATLANITMTENGVAFVGFTVAAPMPTIIRIHATAATGLAANANYVITVPTTFTDTFGQGLPTPFVIHFMTGP